MGSDYYYFFSVSYIYISTYLTSVNWEQICSPTSTFPGMLPFFFPLLVSLPHSTSLLPSQKDISTCPAPPKQSQDKMMLLPTLTQAPWLLSCNPSRPSPSKPCVVAAFLAASIHRPPAEAVSTMSTPALNTVSSPGSPPTPSA